MNRIPVKAIIRMRYNTGESGRNKIIKIRGRVLIQHSILVKLELTISLNDFEVIKNKNNTIAKIKMKFVILRKRVFNKYSSINNLLIFRNNIPVKPNPKKEL